MKKEERTIETVGQPSIESLPKDKADIFYRVLLSGAQTYYVNRCMSDDLNKKWNVMLDGKE